MDPISVVVPTRPVLAQGFAEADVADVAALLSREVAWLAAELGAPARVVEADPGRGRRLLVGPRAANPAMDLVPPPPDARPRVRRLTEALLVADAPDRGSLASALALLRTLRCDGRQEVVAAPAADLGAAVERVATEAARTVPRVVTGEVDWVGLTAAHAEAVRSAPEALAALQQWVASVGDLHTTVVATAPQWRPPYAVWVDAEGRARLTDVPVGSAGWHAGARRGDPLVAPAAGDVRERVGAPAHARALLAGRRLLATPCGQSRTLAARRHDGTLAEWVEREGDQPNRPLVRWRRAPTGVGMVAIDGWARDGRMDDDLDLALTELAGDDRLVVDLRGNAGGELVVAQDARDRFLRAGVRCGTARYTTADPRAPLSAPAPIDAQPSARVRWHGRVRVLTDPLTASASEDFLLGLQGLDHVAVVGEASAGGSGRPRVLELLEGARLSLATALTYDREGRCVEGAGIPVDVPVAPARFDPDAPDAVLAAAVDGW